MQTVIVTVPGRPHLAILFQNNTGNIGLLETDPDREPGRSGDDDNRRTVRNGIKHESSLPLKPPLFSAEAVRARALNPQAILLLSR